VCKDCPEEQEVAEVLAEVEIPNKPTFRPLQLEDEDNLDIVEQATPERQEVVARPGNAPRVISEQNAYLIRSMMMDVVKRGTATKALELGRQDLAGKTGTTNEQRDAWFSGYNNEIVTSVWVGFDNHDPLGYYEVGGKAALPIWIDYMRVALRDVPDEPVPLPDGITLARINPETGLLARLDNPDGIMEVFETGSLPPMEDRTEGTNSETVKEENPYDNF
jgi:penicillin-binding protein 1A